MGNAEEAMLGCLDLVCTKCLQSRWTDTALDGSFVICECGHVQEYIITDELTYEEFEEIRAGAKKHELNGDDI